MAAVMVAYNEATRVPIVNSQKNNMFPDKQTGTGVDYGWLGVWNTGDQTLTAGAKFYFTVDVTGAVLSAQIADSGGVRAQAYAYPQTVPSGSFTIPTDTTSGISLPAIAPGQKCLICIKRDTTGAGAVAIENNGLNVFGPSPI